MGRRTIMQQPALISCSCYHGSVERGAWSVERGAWSVERGAWSVERGAWSVERGAWSVERGAWSVERGAWSVERGAWSVERGAWSVERGAWSVERGAWSVERGAWSVERGAWSVERGAWSVERGAWSVERGAWSVERGAWSVERGAWSVERGAWSVERGAWSVEQHDVARNCRQPFPARFPAQPLAIKDKASNEIARAQGPGNSQRSHSELIRSVLVELLLDQITDGGRTSNFRFFFAQRVHRFTSFSLVFRTDRQVDGTRFAINVDDACFNSVAFFQLSSRIFDALFADFACFQDSDDVSSQFDQCLFRLNFNNATGNDSAFVVDGQELSNRVALELFDAERDTFAFRIDRQDDGFSFVTFAVFANCFFTSFRPRDVRQVNQTVDAAFQTDEDTEVSDGLDGTGNAVAFVVGRVELFPRVLSALFDTQRDTTTFFVDIQNHNFDVITNVDDFGRMDVFVGPIHFGYVNQTFNTFFQLCEAAIVGQISDTCFDLGVFRVTRFDVDPRIFTQLFQTQRNAVAFAVEFQHFHVDFVAYCNDFRRMLDAFPCHVRDVQQAVNAAQINECTVVCEVFDDTFDLLTFLQGRQQSFTFSAVFSFENGTTGNNNVVAFRIELDDFEVQLFVFEVSRVTHRTDVNQRTRQERTDRVNVYGEAAFDFTVDHAFDDLVVFECSFQLFPSFSAFCFFA
ncbi:predicted membrane protein [Zymobacter palmae]|uniref:Predicted membrane protein n=1 Tax=Zymobacter palmae TaxID=33074 RepID=A0A348HDK5_9GAMM|nr:predicted membrane protein [Zymobacter palmae]